MLEVKIIKISISQMGFAIVLKSDNSQGVLPIFIAPLETSAISNVIEGKKSERPMTHDLAKNMIERLGATVEKVFIDNYSNGIFYSKIYLRSGTRFSFANIEVDARPSDAIALALRFYAPIFVAKKVYNKHAVNMDIRALEFSEDKFFDSLASLFADTGSPDDLMGAKMVDAILEEFSESEKSSKEDKEEEKNPKNYKSKQQVLKQMLKNAIAKEQYEDAASIRDELKNFEKGGSQK